MKESITIDGIVYDRARLGIDGDCGYALLGLDIQSGEAEFVKISEIVDTTKCGDLSNPERERLACAKALRLLKERLCMPNLSYYRE